MIHIYHDKIKKDMKYSSKHKIVMAIFPKLQKSDNSDIPTNIYNSYNPNIR